MTKRLSTESKDGCCFHVDSEYETKSGHPVHGEAVSTGGQAGDGFLLVTRDRLERGTWHHAEKRKRIK